MLRMADDRAAIAHLLRRATFGPAPGQVEALNAGGRAAALDQVLAATPPPLPAAPNLEGWDPPIWWMLRMADPAVGLAEKMTWFWHAHLCTSVDKVGSWLMMWNQHMLLRNNALGNFRTLLQQLTIDPAMLIYLDGDPSVVTAPNENYSREVMELFAMGSGNYTEADVRNGAKALAGWDVNWETGVATFFPAVRAHHAGDVPRAQRAAVQRRRRRGVRPRRVRAVHRREAAQVLPRRRPVADAPHRAGDDLPQRQPGDPAAGRGDPARPDVLRPVGAPQPGQAPGGVGHQRVRRRRVRANGGWQASVADNLGQLPFYPPSVAGWPGGTRWLAAANAIVRADLAHDGPVLAEITNATDMVGTALARCSVYELSAATRAALDQVAASTLPKWQRSRLLLALTLCTPEFALA